MVHSENKATATKYITGESYPLKRTRKLNFTRVEDWLMNYLPAHELFTKTNHKPIDLHFKFNTFSINFVPSLYFKLPTI